MKKISRRTFVENSSALLAASALSIGRSQVVEPSKLHAMFVHHVYFWLKEANNQESHARLLKGLQTLPAIKAIHMAHIGVPATTNRDVIDRSYQFSLLLLFKNQADQDAYQVHPTHLQFVKDCSSLWEKVVVYDSVDA